MNVTNINVYSNVHVHNAVVGVSEERFGRGAVQTTRVEDARVRELTPVRGALDVKPVSASVMSADRASIRPPEAARERTVVATRAPRDFSSSLRAQGLGAERQATPAAAQRIVPAPKRTIAATPPSSEGPSSSQRPRGETPNARRGEPGNASPPGTPPPRPRAREGASAPSAPQDTRQPDAQQGRRPQVEDNERGRKLNPPPPPPAHDTADSRHGRGQGQGQGQEQRRRPEGRQAPQQRAPERAPEKSEQKQPEK